MKARTPSAASSLKISFCLTGSKSSVAATGPCSMALMTFSRVATTASGACAAMRSAMAKAASSCWPAGTTFCTKFRR